MAVISELIDLGLALKQKGKLEGAIEHFRQLQATYPDNARIMFELGACWTALGVPKQALTLYRELMALPKGKGLPAKDVPRLYTRLGATLLALNEFDEALSVIDEGLRLHPSYRPLRAFRIFCLDAAGMPRSALNDALDLMLESLAPSRWDTFEDEIRGLVTSLHVDDGYAGAQSATHAAAETKSTTVVAKSSSNMGPADVSGSTGKAEPNEAAANASSENAPAISKIEVDQIDLGEQDIELRVKVVKREKQRARTSKKKAGPGQFGNKAVRIDISATGDKHEGQPDDDAPATAAGKLEIPIDFD